MKRIFLLFLTILSLNVNAQFTDNFSDGDFTNNPTWSGDDSVFVITQQSSNNRLRSNKLLTNSTYYLSTPSTKATEAQWEFFVNLQFNTSGANYVDIYLIADDANLMVTNINGYFVRMGRTQDDICLYKRSGLASSSVVLIDGLDGILNTSNNNIKVKVTRNAANEWKLERDISGVGGSFFVEGTATDATFTNSTHFGISITHSTVSFIQRHFFDDFYIGDIIVDLTPPTATAISVLNANSVEITFDEAVKQSTAENIANYVVNNGIGSPTTAVRNTANKVTLTFATNFTSALQNILSIDNVEDLEGNAISNTQELSFTYFAPFVAQKGDIVINELMSDPTPVVGLPEREFVELYNTTNIPINLQGFKFSDPSSTATLGNFIIQPKSYLILCANADTATFRAYGEVLGISPWPSLNNSSDIMTLRNQNNEIIDEVAYELSWYNDAVKDDGGWTLELINPYAVCGGRNNWNASVDADGGTPGRKNSIFDTIPDITPPLITSIAVNNENSVFLTFNEIMDTASFRTSNWVFSGNLDFTNVLLTGSAQTVLVYTANPIDTGVVYNLLVQNLKDCSGNTMADTTVEFGIGRHPDKGDLIINELLPDELPSVGLPEREFLELYNRSNKLIDLKDCKLSDLTSTTTLVSAVLKPNEYIILTTTTAASQFTVYGRVLGVTSWPSLNNASDKITLTNKDNIIIDEVEYFDTWYRDNDKKQGGWTLERINPETDCSGPNNWIASVDAQGGTPGKQNSVLSTAPDLVAPKLISAEINSVNSILLTFDKTMDTASFRIATYTFTNGLTLQGINQQSDFSKILLITSNIDTGKVYQITVTGVKDCPQNVIGSQNIAEFGIGKTPQLFEIVINEIMANEVPSQGLPESEYLEIYNRSNSLLSLQGCKLSDLTSTANLPNTIIKPGEYLILTKTTTEAEFVTLGRAIGVTSWPSLNNTGDKMTIVNIKGQLVHSVNYSDSWYGNANKKNGGWALEMIDFENPCAGAENWRASENSIGGTPGKINSIYAQNPDLTAPSLIRADAANDSVIVLTFNEQVDSLSAVTANYIFNNQLTLKQVLFNPNVSQRINLVTQNKIQPKTVYSITVSGVKDCIGNSSVATTLDFLLPEQGDSFDIVINEVLFNPRVGGSDFVEIFNRSDKNISLTNWKLANLSKDTISTERILFSDIFNLRPNSYLVFTKDTFNIKNEYPRGNTKVYVQLSSLPSYNDKDGIVILKNNFDKVVDRFDYDEKMHFPLIDDKNGVSLERININAETQNRANWHSASSTEGYATPGYKNSQGGATIESNSVLSIEPRTFSPDDDGFFDYTLIGYKMDKNGYVATITIFDANGRLVRSLVNGELLSVEGFYQWDGINDKGLKANVGLYVVVMEVFDLDGNVKRYRESVAIGARF
jgi:hypothetical protein